MEPSINNPSYACLNDVRLNLRRAHKTGQKLLATLYINELVDGT
jgi:hypothetical protein